MGHGGMLYSLPSRDLIADCVEYMVKAHCADALICISNCDKITPGHADGRPAAEHPDGLRLRRPDGGRPARRRRHGRKLDLIDAIVDARQTQKASLRRGHARRIEEAACPTCGSCSGMFTANSMNCLTEALGLALPGNGSILATHTARKALYEDAGRTVVDDHPPLLRAGRRDGPAARRSPPARRSRTRWPSTSRWAARPTRSCTCWPPPRRRASTSAWTTSTRSRAGCRACARSRRTSPGARTTWRTSHRAGGIPAILGELHRAGLLNEDVPPVHAGTLGDWLDDVGRPRRLPVRPRPSSCATRRPAACAPPRPSPSPSAGSRSTSTPPSGCIRDVEHAYSEDGGLAVLHGNLAVDGCVVKTAGVDESIWTFRARRSSASRRRRPSRGSSAAGQGRRRRRHPLRGPPGRPRHAGDALPDLATSRAAAWARPAR